MSSARLSMKRASVGESGMRVLPEMFKHRLHQLAEETVDSLQKIWKEAGYEEVECQRLLGDLLTKMKITCTNELAAEHQILEHAKQEVELNISEFRKLSDQLGRTIQIAHLDSMNYTDKLTELERMITEITVEVSQRQKILNTELLQIQELVSSLGEEFPDIEAFKGPVGTPELSDVRLELMRRYKAQLEASKVARAEEIRSIVNECKKHIADLVLMEEGFNTMPDASTFVDCDKKLVKCMAPNADYSIWGVNKRELVTLSKRLMNLSEEKERRREQLAKTGQEIARLWTLLRIPSVERDKFSGSFKMNLSMETLAKGADELQRLKDVRVKSIGRVVSSIRSDILTLWEEAGIESDECRMREFPLYFDPIDQLDDSAVDLHEAYFTTLRVRVDELKPILQKIARRETVVQERVDLEHIQMNPERLTARGPNAREERKREENMSSRVRNLEKYTKELIAVIQAWEDVNGPFMYGGVRYFDRIAHQEEVYVEIRDSLRNARKKKDGKVELTLPASKMTTTAMSAKKAPGTLVHSSSVKGKQLNEVNIAALNQQLHSSHAAQHGPVSTIERLANAENINPADTAGGRGSDASHNSADTCCTSATEIRERPSTATVIKGSYQSY